MTTPDISRIVAEMRSACADFDAVNWASIKRWADRLEAIAQQPSNAVPDGRAWTGGKTELLPGGALLIHDPVKIDSVIDWLERNPNCLMFHPFNHPTRAWSVAPSSRRNNDGQPGDGIYYASAREALAAAQEQP